MEENGVEHGMPGRNTGKTVKEIYTNKEIKYQKNTITYTAKPEKNSAKPTVKRPMEICTRPWRT